MQGEVFWERTNDTNNNIFCLCNAIDVKHAICSDEAHSCVVVCWVGIISKCSATISHLTHYAPSSKAPKPLVTFHEVAKP